MTTFWSYLIKQRFSAPSMELLSAVTPEFVDWWGKNVEWGSQRIVRLNGKSWFVKFKPDPEEQKRDYLAYLLGRQWVNVAEVYPLGKIEFKALRFLGIPVPAWASWRTTFLVRLGQDYRVDQLPNTNLDVAVAHELVFSLWIRRRDAHAANRVYVNQVPVFFDHQTAFLGEPSLADLDVFFQPGRDAGYASRWRVEKADPATVVATVEIRQSGRAREAALHIVKDVGCFEKALQEAVAHVQSQPPDLWLQAARAAGYTPARAHEIMSFLTRNSEELDRAIERMRTVIFAG